MNLSKSNFAIAHSWLSLMGGAEQVLKAVCEVVPNKEVYTLLARDEFARELLGDVKVHVGSLNLIPRIEDLYRNFLPVLPFFIERLRVSPRADFLISMDAGLIKGISNPNKIPHICYCHSPPRYLWDLQGLYENRLEGLSFFKKVLFRLLLPYLRAKDLKYAQGVDHFVANSDFVRKRIEKNYKRHADVIYPPVNLERFKTFEGQTKENYYICVSRLVPYKRIDLSILAAKKAGVNLLVIGSGPEKSHLEKLAKGANVKFLENLNPDELSKKLAGAKAFLCPQIEDFGISTVEALACGTPVIAYGEGGSLEIVTSETGVFFNTPDSEALADAIRDFEKREHEFSPQKCTESVQRFSEQSFKVQFSSFLKKKLNFS